MIRTVSCFNGVEHANIYVRYRPQYPVELYDYIFRYLDDGQPEKQHRKVAIDVGCGSGQNTSALVDRFDEIIGLDVSEAQLEEARKLFLDHKNVHFHCASATKLSDFVGEGSVDLITAATALHWFDVEEFFRECHKVLRPGGVVAAFCYDIPSTEDPRAHKALRQILDGTLANYFAPEYKYVKNCYEDFLPVLKNIFPCSEKNDSFEVKLKLSIEDACGFLRTMSPYQIYRKQNPEMPDPAVKLSKELESIYGKSSDDQENVVTGCLKIFMLLGKK